MNESISHVVCHDLEKTFKDDNTHTVAFQNVSIEIPQGEFCAIVGPSGCGKSTLLRTIAGLESSTAGQLSISGDSRHRTNMVFQDNDLFPWMTLRRNIEFLLENNPRIPPNEIRTLTDHYLSKTGLEAFGNYFPGEVSGGMRQRTSIARAFANTADLLLMDEPFVFLDYQSRVNLHLLLTQIWQESKKTVVFVTHDIEEAVFLADRIIVMTAHPGTIAEQKLLNFPRPRRLSELRKDPEYLEIVNNLTESFIGQ